MHVIIRRLCTAAKRIRHTDRLTLPNQDAWARKTALRNVGNIGKYLSPHIKTPSRRDIV